MTAGVRIVSSSVHIAVSWLSHRDDLLRSGGATVIEATELEYRYLPGTPVEVLNRFTDGWCRGFAVAEPVPEGYRLFRLSDGATLPVVFRPEQVRHRPPA
jgi:hypothetical protein